MKVYMTAKEIAAVIKVTKRSVQLTAAKQSWPFKTFRVRGGHVRAYPLDEMPFKAASRVIQCMNKSESHEQ